MNKKVISAIVIVLAIAAACGYAFLSNKSSGQTPGTSSSGSAGKYSFAKPEPLSVTGVGGVQPATVDLGDGPVPVIQIPLDTWGYAQVFAANGGTKPNKDSLFYKKGHFAVELIREESAQAQLNGYASGKWPIIWAPADSLPSLYDALRTDKRLAPKVVGLFDWSTGGDGIVVRNSIKRPADLKGKIVLTSSNTPYSFMLLWYLAQVGLTGNDVKVVWIDDGDKALRVFKNDPDIAAWVTWSPYIADSVDPKSDNYVSDSRILITSKDTNQLIADTFIVRNDFFQDKPELVTAFTEAIIEGGQSISNKTFEDMATFYGLASPAEAKAMLGELHIANFPETQMFLDPANPIGVNKVFLLSQEYSIQIGVIPETSSYDPDAVIDRSVIEEIGKKGIFKSQKNGMIGSFNKTAKFNISDLENQRVILANDIKVYFDAQKLDFDVDSKDANVVANMKMLGDVASQSKVLATSVIKLVGHLDTAKVAEFKALGPQEYAEAAAQAKATSKGRAAFIAKVLVEKFGVDKDRVVTEGRGWSEPLEGAKPEENRRVEVKFISLE